MNVYQLFLLFLTRFPAAFITISRAIEPSQQHWFAVFFAGESWAVIASMKVVFKTSLLKVKEHTNKSE